MKNKNYTLRVFLTILVGLLMVYKTYQFKYSDFIFDEIIYKLIGIVGLVVWGSILRLDLKELKEYNQTKYLINGVIGITALILGLAISWRITNNFNKPTLVKIFYDGDFNGTAIDFKKDGTYIFDNFCTGSNYEYGSYEIRGDDIELDKKNIANVIQSNHLKIVEEKVTYEDEIKEENYVFQIDENGNRLDNKIEFRVTIDNRKK